MSVGAANQYKAPGSAAITVSLGYLVESPAGVFAPTATASEATHELIDDGTGALVPEVIGVGTRVRALVRGSTLLVY